MIRVSTDCGFYFYIPNTRKVYFTMSKIYIPLNCALPEREKIRVVNSPEIYFLGNFPGLVQDSIGFRSYRPPTDSGICLSFALLLCNHHRRLRCTWSGCSLPAKPTQLSFHPLPYPATNPSMCVGGRQGGVWES